jgi:hypothetical protein
MTHAALTKSLKRALVQTIPENRDVFRDLFAEVLEDAAFARAIREGEKTRPVKRQTVMRALTGRMTGRRK